MRAVVIASLLALAWPTMALAQSAPAPAAPPASAMPAPPGAAPVSPAPLTNQSMRGKDITRDQYIETAKQRAAARFDKADTNHDGVLTAAERRAARPKRNAASSQ